MMPKQKPGRSRQDYATPDIFIQAFEKRFGEIAFDLAASEENSKSKWFYSVEDNSLTKKWSGISGNLWLNPPYENISDWAQKAAIESSFGAKVFMLVPASVGSNWFGLYVQPYAYVLALNPRLSFDGKNAYPKDLMLCCYPSGLSGFGVWRWKE